MPQSSTSESKLLTPALLVIALWGLHEAGPFLIPLFIAGLLAFLVTPLTGLLRRRRVPEWAAVLISALLLVLPIFGLVYVLVHQASAFYHDFPAIMASVNHTLTKFSASSLGQKLNVSSFLNPNALTERLSSSAGQGLTMILAGMGAILGASSSLALVLLFTVLMIASRDHIRRGSEKILMQAESIHGDLLIQEVTALIERFLVARLTIVIMVAALDTAILSLFHINYSFLQGCFLGVMTLLPAVGFVVSVIPPIIVSLAMGHSGFATLVLTGALTLVSFVEGNVLTPTMVGRKLNINTLFSFIGFFAGGLFWGVPGMILSIPLLGILRVVFSAIPHLQPWGDLLAEREDANLRARLVRVVKKAA